MSTRSLAVPVGAALAAAALACGPEDPCANVACAACVSTTVLLVSDGAGGPVSGVQIQGATATCVAEQAATSCALSWSGPIGPVDVAAPGYQTRHLEPSQFAAAPRTGATRADCCPTCETVTLHVALFPGAPPSAFCGSSTAWSCADDTDCARQGCSGEICAGAGQGIASPCLWQACYDATAYGLVCGCTGRTCLWR